MPYVYEIKFYYYWQTIKCQYNIKSNCHRYSNCICWLRLKFSPLEGIHQLMLTTFVNKIFRYTTGWFLIMKKLHKKKLIICLLEVTMTTTTYWGNNKWAPGTLYLQPFYIDSYCKFCIIFQLRWDCCSSRHFHGIRSHRFWGTSNFSANGEVQWRVVEKIFLYLKQ